MFTGLIEALGHVEALSPVQGDFVLKVGCPAGFLEDVVLGDSIAVNGVCLTVTDFSANWFAADVSRETVTHTAIKGWARGVRVNLEKALTLQKRLGGHIVTGHVDGLGDVVASRRDARSLHYVIKAPASLQRYIAAKGSITVDGVSLTVNAVTDDGFELNIVPHTATETTLNALVKGCRVHLEVDILARYAERLLAAGADADSASSGQGSKLNKHFLAQHGFLKS